jgi:uncharacterized phage protein (TIGR02220 family)
MTYGFGKQSDRISLSQLQGMTGLSRWRVTKAVQDLGGLLKVVPGSKGVGANEYSLSLNISTGQLASGVQSVTSGESVTSHLSSVQNAPLPNQFQTNKKENVRDKPSPPNSFSPIIEKTIRRLNELSGKSYRPESKSVTKYLRARLKEGVTEADCLAVVEDRWQRWKDKADMVEHFNPVTLFRPSNFERYLTEARAANGAGREPVVKDLGDGWLEVDGKRMTAATYKLRYGQGPKPTA